MCNTSRTADLILVKFGVYSFYTTTTTTNNNNNNNQGLTALHGPWPSSKASSALPYLMPNFSNFS
jgi:hypothetical protein